MSGPSCPRCGAPVVVGAAFCASCGSSLTWTATPTLTTGAPPPSNPLPAYVPSFRPIEPPSPSGSLSSFDPLREKPTESAALHDVQWAATLALVGALLSVVSLFDSNTTTIFTVTSGTSGTSISVSATGLASLAAIAALGLALTIAEVILYRSAFRKLSPIDPRFSSPATFALVFLITAVLLALLAVALFAEIFQAIQCAAGGPISSYCLNAGALLGILGLLVVVAIVAFIGYIGLLVGIWRLGSRFGDSLFKVGAVLLFIPLLNVIGSILVLVAARGALRELGMGPRSAGFG